MVAIFSLSSSQVFAWWDITVVDTMKYSRDMAREYAGGKDADLDARVALIADTGATHIAIGTPYDEEFSPALKKWVRAARKHNLKVWFRGNWSGWEEWFDHDLITREDHIAKTKKFILDNPDLFEDGDIFSACPECENGGPGDPRMTGDVEGFRDFLIDEHNMMESAFKKINKDVQFNVNSMNGDVAKLIMDKKTTKALGGIIAVDHYVETPEQLADDVVELAANSGGKVFLGEMGAPIPDIHGNMTEKEQAEWLDDALGRLAKIDDLAGLNYWTAQGGSTAIWSDTNKPRAAVAVLKKYFKPEKLQSTVVSTNGKQLKDVSVTSQYKKVLTDDSGAFALPYLEKTGNVIFTKDGYKDAVYPFADLQSGTEIVLEPLQTDWFDSFKQWLFSLFS
jgi:hypothetical protein